VALSPDGRRIVAGGGSPDGKGVVRAWDAETGAPAWSGGDHAAEVLAVAYAPDGSSLASAGADGVVQLRDPRTGTVARTLPGHARGATALAFSADGAALACGGGDGSVVLWETRTARRLRTFPSANPLAGITSRERSMTSVALSRDGGTLAACTAGVNEDFTEPARLWDARTGELR